MDRDRRRRFGQNFLDAETASLLASDIPLSASDSILEIGPGHGALTEPLLSRGVPVTAIEIDEECVAVLRAIPNFMWSIKTLCDFPSTIGSKKIRNRGLREIYRIMCLRELSPK